MYLAVRKYRKVEGDEKELMARIQRGFVPLISRIDGFVDYYCFIAEDGSLISVSVYRDERGAEESVRAASRFVEQQLAEFLPEKPEVIAGEVLAHASGQSRGELTTNAARDDRRP
ncbi:hypothetical protein [Sandaracinus amylolyticus]|uniref:ABM domain-containing protein n=1 Tax=Sandaracinus amylolyticus TaxID=927083 RepID=A0A0F6VYM8_9BACT|nr:hypothetical protein [Sandaracinus amylolyticus]AKF02956.1 hypothetical protein DB32_000104 [Sandaracinus amylolyticus]